MQSCKLQYVSDIHLEMINIKNIPIIDPIEDNIYLALCGDIGNPFIDTYKQFLKIHTKLFKHILIVSGNHEYYTSMKKQRTMEMADVEIQKIVSEFDNVTYLNMGKVIISRTKFIGCTLWSDVSNILEIAESVMNDYKNIYVDNPNTTGRFEYVRNGYRIQKKWIKENRRKLRAVDVVKIHQKHKEFIKDQLDKFDPKDPERKYDKIIVLTHHAPSFSLLTKSDLYSSCYGTNCDVLFKEPVLAWISGHTHHSTSIEINGVKAVSNCMGYPGQRGTDYDSSVYLEFP